MKISIKIEIESTGWNLYIERYQEGQRGNCNRLILSKSLVGDMKKYRNLPERLKKNMSWTDGGWV